MKEDLKYSMNFLESDSMDKEVTKLSLNLNLDIVKPGTVMKIKIEQENKTLVGQVHTVNHKELNLFCIDSESNAEVRNFSIDEFTSGRCIPYIVNIRG